MAIENILLKTQETLGQMAYSIHSVNYVNKGWPVFVRIIFRLDILIVLTFNPIDKTRDAQ